MIKGEECRIFPSLSISIPEISSRIMSIIALDLAMMNSKSLKLEFHGFIRATKLVIASRNMISFFLLKSDEVTRPLKGEGVRYVFIYTYTIYPTLIEKAIPCIVKKNIQ